MKKIPTLFQRNGKFVDYPFQVHDEVTPGCEWVLAGEGRPTRKWDGTAVLVRSGQLYKRFEVKQGMPMPPGFIQAQDPDEATGKQPGWVPVLGDKSDKWIEEATVKGRPADGTYELCGPKINANPDAFCEHVLIPHGVEEFMDFPRTYETIKAFLKKTDVEGIVWWHPDGRRAKIKGKDFGFKRGGPYV